MQKVRGENKEVKWLLNIDKMMNVGKPEVNNFKVKEISQVFINLNGNFVKIRCQRKLS